MSDQPLPFYEANETPVSYPLVSNRYRAVVYDSIIIIALIFIITSVLNNIQNVSDTVRIACFIALGLYDPLFTAFLGCTPGQRLMGLAVRKVSDEHKKINIFAAFSRSLVKGLLGTISFFTVSGANKGRAIHDLIAGSVVIYADGKER